MRVLEMGHGIAGAFAARLLGDFGAEVVKVERPGRGDHVRRFGPVLEGRRHSAIFELLNWNKESVCLDLGQREAQRTVRKLARNADIVIESFPPGRLSAWSLSPASLRAVNERLVVVSVTNFGQEGPYAHWRASDLVIQAMSGTMRISGRQDREPLKHGMRQASYCAGLSTAYSALAGYFGVLRGDLGTHIDLSILECLASELVMNQSYYAFLGVIQGRRPPIQDPFAGEPLAVADGYVSVQTSQVVPARAYACLMDDARLESTRFATPEGRAMHADELRAILIGHLETERPREFFLRASGAGLLVGFDQSAADLLECPQLLAREAFHVTRPNEKSAKQWRFPARLAHLSQTPTAVGKPAPDLGSAAGSGGWSGRRPARRPHKRLDSSEVSSRGPLTGLRVIDLSTVFAVPYLGGILCDLGAEVIKIEAPHRPDQTRWGWGACFENEPGRDYWNRTTTFQVLNRGKRSASINLNSPQGRELLLGLVAQSDVLLENFRPQVMRRWRASYEHLKEVSPGLIMLSNTGYGSSGPWSEFKAQGTSLEVTMGLAHYTGYPGGGPSKAGQSHPDFLACWAGLVALTAALVHRERTGEGQWIDVGMYQLGIVAMPEPLLEYQATGNDPPRRGNADLGALLSGLFRCHGDDAWVAISIGSDEQLSRLVQLDNVFASVRSGDADALRMTLETWAAGREAGEAAAQLQSVGIAAGSVADAADLAGDPHLARRGFLEWVDYPELGRRPVIGLPFRWHGSGTTVQVRGPGPAFGEGNDYVLRQLLGLSAERVKQLYQLGVVADTPSGFGEPMQPIQLETMLSHGLFTEVERDPTERFAGSDELSSTAPTTTRR